VADASAIRVDDMVEFEGAIRWKRVLEIAGLPPRLRLAAYGPRSRSRVDLCYNWAIIWPVRGRNTREGRLDQAPRPFGEPDDDQQSRSLLWATTLIVVTGSTTRADSLSLAAAAGDFDEMRRRLAEGADVVGSD
jgi:hypothetical protein